MLLVHYMAVPGANYYVLLLKAEIVKILICKIYAFYKWTLSAYGDEDIISSILRFFSAHMLFNQPCNPDLNFRSLT